MTNLVELKGTEKQIQWAEDLRNTYLRKVEDFRRLSKIDKLDTKEDLSLSGSLGYISDLRRLSNYYETYLEKHGIERPGKNYPLEERRAFSRYHNKKSKEEAIVYVEKCIEEQLSVENASEWIEKYGRSIY